MKLVLIEDERGPAEALAFGLCASLPLTHVGTFDRVSKAIAELPLIQPDLAIVDWRMPEAEGVEVVRQLKLQLPITRWVLYTAVPTLWVVREAIEAGVHGCISKGSTFTTLVEGCRTVMAGRPFFCPACTTVLHAIAAHTSVRELNATERVILRHLASGKSTEEIAAAAGVEPKTVHNNKVSIRRKLGLLSNVNLARFAVDHGLAPPD